mgnify:CR=1 FL=1
MDAKPLGFFGRIAAAVLSRPKRWSLCIGLVTLVMALLASRLQVDPNILELLPEDDPTTQAIQRLNEQEGGTNLLTITVNGDDQEVLNAFMLELKSEVEALETVDYVLYELDTELLSRIGLMQQDPEDLYRFYADILQVRNMGMNWQFLPDPGRPFREAAEAVERAEQSHTPFLQEGSARILIRPTGSAYEPEFSRPFMADIYETIDGLDAESRGLEVAWVGGAYRHAVEDLENVIHDLGWTAAVSMGLVLIFLSVAFRDPRAIILLFVPLIVGNIWTLGYANLTVGTLNTFTSFVAAVLIGLGVDFSIHLYARYREERIETDT